MIHYVFQVAFSNVCSFPTPIPSMIIHAWYICPHVRWRKQRRTIHVGKSTSRMEWVWFFGHESFRSFAGPGTESTGRRRWFHFGVRLAEGQVASVKARFVVGEPGLLEATSSHGIPIGSTSSLEIDPSYIGWRNGLRVVYLDTFSNHQKVNYINCRYISYGSMDGMGQFLTPTNFWSVCFCWGLIMKGSLDPQWATPPFNNPVWGQQLELLGWRLGDIFGWKMVEGMS